jgi:hypothetical protein
VVGDEAPCNHVCKAVPSQGIVEMDKEMRQILWCFKGYAGAYASLLRVSLMSRQARCCCLHVNLVLPPPCSLLARALQSNICPLMDKNSSNRMISTPVHAPDSAHGLAADLEGKHPEVEQPLGQQVGAPTWPAQNSIHTPSNNTY